MDGSLGSLFTFLYKFTSGRRLFAHRQVLLIAKQKSFTPLAAHCEAAIAHDTTTRELERRWAGEPADTDTNPAAQAIDVLVDRTLGAVRDGAVAQTQGAPPDDPIHAKVAVFLKRIFPIDVNAVTSQRYIDELATVDDIVKLLQGELAQHVTDLGLGRQAQRLADLAVQYRDALETSPPSLLKWGDVRAARAEGQGLLEETVAIITGKHHKRTPEETAARLELLAPILKQNDAIGQYMRARRTVQDVNPETGQDESGTPSTKEAP